ncbi:MULTISPECIES: transposase [unclassified Clostridium]|uniref:transposase n=1 Tax=unclassified Clostridium TaxID=2614128 RepID=UPI0028A26789|nr:transposase [Clostridium sp.]
MAKSKYETNVKDKLILVEGWVKNGLTDEQISKNLGIAYSTFREYKKEYSALSAALKKGKEVIFEVENALLKRVLGYEYEEVTQERVSRKDERGQPITDIHGFPLYEMVITKKVKKEVTPDTTAQIFWLKNKKPKNGEIREILNIVGIYLMRLI